MKLRRALALFIIVVMAACSENDDFQQIPQNQLELEPLTGSEINAYIHGMLQQTGSFTWSDADDFVLWSALMRGDSILTIGYGAAAYSQHKSTELISQKQEILDVVRSFEEESGLRLKSGTDVVVYDDAVLNFVDVWVGNIETLTALRSMPNIRYLEPAAYRFFAFEPTLKSSSGCDNTPVAVNSNDYRTIAPNCLVSWTYDKHNITQAWSYSTGSGITVGLIDTGVSQDQSMWGSNFNDGYSNGRSIYKYGVYVDSFWPWSTTTDGVWDKCAHGSLMAATLASPRNDNYLPVGVAYNCNLVSYRATKNVVLDGYHEQRGVARALTELGNRSDVKVISMSIGHIFSVGSISDAVKYAYGKGKMIVAAGGTSTEFTNFAGVIFPASMSETVAVTGITDGSGYTECAVCHKGSKIDFTVIMQRHSDDNRRSVCLGFFENTKTYVGGSSVATSTTAGIAALIWGKYPTWTRDQVLARMKQSASLYPNKSADFGYGNINALLAVQ
ncbi:MAG: S8 family serine peptidase [Salinivirgaceae bacterium]